MIRSLWLLYALLSIQCLFLTDACAFLREVPPHTEPKLASDEGLLLVSVDTLTEVQYVRLQREGNIFSSAKLPDLKAGTTTKLYAAPAGRYRWDKVGLPSNRHFELSDDVELKFEIKPGVINYPGDLLFRQVGATRGVLRPINRALRGMDWLEATYPALNPAMPFVYVGHYPDPFPAYYRKARAAHADLKLADLDKTADPPAAEKLPASVAELWQPARIVSVELNPGGDLLAEAVYEKQKWGIDLIDLRAGEARRLVNPPFAIKSLRWFGNHTLVASLGSHFELSFITIFQIKPGAKGYDIANFSLHYNGDVLGALSSDPMQLIVATPSPHGQAMVHRVDVTNQATIDKSRHDYESRLNKGLKDDVAWLVDGDGQVRAALADVDDQLALFYGGGGDYREILRYASKEEPWFLPSRLSPDGNLIYGFTEQGRGQRDFVAFDPVTKSITQTLFSKPDVDVLSALYDRTGVPIGATYYEGGHIASSYFDEANRHLNESIEQAFPDRTALIMARDDAGKTAILGVDGTDSPFAIYQLDVEHRRASLIDEDVPALSKRKWVPSVVVRGKGVDGVPIEAYLTLPGAIGKQPLIVLAHGGPIGVRDQRHFDPEVQFLASLGYAVLQVNFRGSDGYGRAYREAGKRGYGTLIEDDIDSALEAALGQYPLDATRMCAMGTSYGGYSALMSAIRHPDRFRCVISIAGPTDRILSFTASDGSASAAGRKALEKYIGDPRAQPDGIERISPVYNVDALTAPVLLVHGSEDRRVDYENAQRLVRMLSLAGRPPALIALKGEGHGLTLDQSRQRAYPAIAAFLQRHLAVIVAEHAKP